MSSQTSSLQCIFCSLSGFKHSNPVSLSLQVSLTCPVLTDRGSELKRGRVFLFLSARSVIIQRFSLKMPGLITDQRIRTLEGGRWITATSLQAHYPRSLQLPQFNRASMLQRSMYTSTKPLFTSSSSQLFTFIYPSLFFICWFSPPSASFASLSGNLFFYAAGLYIFTSRR